ncbi:MAG: M48 family metallopeptidase [Candidatus Diapherotrites archaeon]|nr:M48 family metallopeptidase [Candidatus Diapherotrites archaeon]
MIDFYEQVSKNKRMTYVLFFMFFVLIGTLAYLMSFVLNIYSGGGFAFFFTIFGVLTILFAIISYYASDRIVTAISGAKEAPIEDYKKLHNIVEELAIASGIPKPRIFTINDSAINAFATGRDPAHAVVCVTTGCLTRLNRDQLQGVIAHELSHIKNYDIRTMTLATVLVGIAVLISDFMIRFIFYSRPSGDSDSKGSGIFFIIIIVVAVILAILTPIIAQMIQFAISRKREFVADASAVEMTRNPEGLASALETISKDTEPLEAANKATAHLYIANPLKGQKLWMKSLFSTHPDINLRIKILRGE